MKTARATVLGLLLSLTACSSDLALGPDATSDARSDALSDAAPDAEADAVPDAAADVTQDAAPDAGPELLAAPYQPEPPAAPYVDRPFLQETNHTTPEVPPGVGALVAALPGLAGFEALGEAVLVGPRGVLRPGTDGVYAPDAIDAADADLLAAVPLGASLLLVGPKRLYLATPEPGLTPLDPPAGLSITGAVGGAEDALVLTTWGLARVDALGQASFPATQGVPVLAAARGETWLWLATADGVRAWPLAADPATDPPFAQVLPAQGLPAEPVVALLADITLPEPFDLLVITAQRIVGIHVAPQSGVTVLVNPPDFALIRVPLTGARAAVRHPDGGPVIATSGGVMRLVERGFEPEWRVYGAERWLPSEDVRGVAVTEDGTLWFATAGGPAHVTVESVTLEQKLAAFVDRVLARHDRLGAVADSHLTRRGDITSNIPWDSDNDGTWSSFWVASECFRWKVTGAADAKANFDRSLDAMLRLRELTGTDWFVARAVIEKATCNLDDCDDPDDGEWFTSADGKWWVKGDTSNDEIAAHLFMMGPAYDLCADAAQRARIADHIDGIVGGIVDHDWLLWDVDEQVTTYGQWDPFYVNESLPGQFGDGGVRSVEILAALTLAHYMTGDARYLEAKAELIDEHGYADNAIREKHYSDLRARDGSNDQMAAFSWYVLLRYETDPALRAQWVEGWGNTYADMREHQAAWWNMIEASAGGAEYDLDLIARWLRLAPVDMVRWDLHNSHRKDLVPVPLSYMKDGAIRSDGYIIPYEERRCDRWNTDSFRVDGGMGGWIEMDGADVLAPYWMARYYGFIVPE
ncbi:MAG: hypothetical protein H6744_21270 [Deltaproteobacteria bacterium]|nr:hypothetical protein [Deltaproteobacteria bacterium]